MLISSLGTNRSYGRNQRANGRGKGTYLTILYIQSALISILTYD